MKFRSIKSKLLAIILSGLFLMAMTISAVAVTITHTILHTDADSILSTQCETEATKINDALNSIEHSVLMMRHYAVTELNNDLSVITNEEKQEAYLKKLDDMFREITFNTPQAINYYIRLNHTLTSPTAGFYYYVDSETKVATKMENTDLTKFSPDEFSEVGWYYVPKRAAQPVWLSPYQQSHNSQQIISFVAPYYAINETTFIGVIGIDIPYSFLTEKVSSISVHDNGSATLFETEPTINTQHNLAENKTAQAKQPLRNGMYLFLEAKYADIQRESRALMHVIVLIAAVITIVFVVITIYATDKIITPLKLLAHFTNEFSEGNYDLELEYKGNDEIATMAKSLKIAAARLKEQMNHVSTLAFCDALTGVRSTAAFNQATANINLLLENTHHDFAVVVADVNYLKLTNDTYGHVAGNKLLCYTAKVLTKTFKNSHVYRVGGDEFTIILEGKDYENREDLIKALTKKSVGGTIQLSESTELPVSFAFGMATYTKELDQGFEDVLKHADSAMYLHKRSFKKAQLQSME